MLSARAASIGHWPSAFATPLCDSCEGRVKCKSNQWFNMKFITLRVSNEGPIQFRRKYIYFHHLIICEINVNWGPTTGRQRGSIADHLVVRRVPLYAHYYTQCLGWVCIQPAPPSPRAPLLWCLTVTGGGCSVEVGRYPFSYSFIGQRRRCRIFCEQRFVRNWDSNSRYAQFSSNFILVVN